MQPKSVKSLFVIIYSLLLATFASCGQLDVEQALSDAEGQFLAGNFDVAASSCDMLADSTQTQLTSTQMCRLAIIYAKLSEAADNQDYMASATNCFERAQALDNSVDSLDIYIETLEVEDQSVVRVIKEVAHSMNTPYDFSRESDEEISHDYGAGVDELNEMI